MAGTHNITYKREVTGMSLYIKYKTLNSETKVTRQQYIQIIRKYNEGLFLKILDMKKVNLPGLGNLSLVRMERNFTKANKNVNFAETRRLGFIVYHTDGQFWAVDWDKFKTPLKNKKINRFILNRINKKIISDKCGANNDTLFFYSIPLVKIDMSYIVYKREKIKKYKEQQNEINKL